MKANGLILTYISQYPSNLFLNTFLKAPIKELEDEKKDHISRLLKMEKEMEEVFERKVQEKQKKLTATEDDLKKKLQESQDNLDKQKADLDAKMATFEKVCYLPIYCFNWLVFK